MIGGNSYIVEFPKDEEEDDNRNIKEKWLVLSENYLAASFALSLNLKRKRETELQPLLSYSAANQENLAQDWKKLKVGHQDSSNMGVDANDMAEEAGLNMPQPQP